MCLNQNQNQNLKQVLQKEQNLGDRKADLKNEEPAAQRGNQQGKGLKILIPNQILRRLPIPLFQ